MDVRGSAAGSLPEAIGGYRILRRLGEGGMGETYLAVRTGAGGFERQVAIKVIRPERAEEPRLRELFLREGKLAGAINHRAVVQVFDVGADDGRFFLVMEHLRGMNLRQLARAQGGRLPWSAAAWIIGEAARGLAAAHQLRLSDAPDGLIHGDISPSNLMACVDGAVKVLDFGLARPAGGERSTSGIAGKLAYMPPESANGGAFDHRVDIYSLGVSLYVVLTGVQPFEGRNDFETVQRVMQHRVDPPSSVVGEIPAEIDQVVARATARQPSERFADAASMADALDRIVGVGFGSAGLARMVGGAMQEAGAIESTDRSPSSSGQDRPVDISMDGGERRWRQWHLAGAVALLAAIVAVALWSRAGSTSAPAGQLAPPATGSPTPTASPSSAPWPGEPAATAGVPPLADDARLPPPASHADSSRVRRRPGRGRKPAVSPPAPPADRPKPRSDDVQPDMPIRF